VLDRPGPFRCRPLLLFLAEGREELLAVIDEHAVRSRDQFSAIEAVTLALLSTDHLTAAEAVVDQLVTLSHAVAFDSVQEDLTGSRLLLSHSQRLLCKANNICSQLIQN